jgi:hypothetical protein
MGFKARRMSVRFRPEFQQIAFLNTGTGKFLEKRLVHTAEAERFHGAQATAGQQVRVGVEASGHTRQVERLMWELQCELWIGSATEIQSKRGRKPKTQRATDDATINETKAA